MNARDEYRDGVRLVFTPDERRSWRTFADDCADYWVCVAMVVLCIAVTVLREVTP